MKLLLICAALVGMVGQTTPDRGEKNAQVLGEFIEKHCRVVAPLRPSIGMGGTIGEIKCDLP